MEEFKSSKIRSWLSAVSCRMLRLTTHNSQFTTFFSLSLFVTLVSCSPGANSNKITVAAAASTQYVLEDLIETFEVTHDLKVEKVISSSGKLAAQIENGGPFDLFISADTKYPNYLHSKGLSVDKPIVYARGKVVMWTYDDIDLSSTLDLLASPTIEKIGMADPQTAPYGELCLKMLQETGVYDNIKEKIVLGESISQVNQYVTTKAVDIGLTSKSVVMAPKLKGKGHFQEIPDYSLEQSMIMIQKNENTSLFYSFLQSEAAKSIFEKHGYL